jgi:hypothetical protein
LVVDDVTENQVAESSTAAAGKRRLLLLSEEKGLKFSADRMLLKHRLKAYMEKRRSSCWTEGKKEMKASPATPAERLGGGREQKVG